MSTVMDESVDAANQCGLPSALIRRLMTERRLRKVDLVALTGLSRPSIDRHSGGKIEPNIGQRALYARAFGMTPADFETAWLTGRLPAAPQNAHAFV